MNVQRQGGAPPFPPLDTRCLQRRELTHPLVDETGHPLATQPVGPLRPAVANAVAVAVARGSWRRQGGVAPRGES